MRAASTRRQPLAAQAVGQPVAISGLARLLMQLRNRPTLHLVKNHADTRRPVPAQFEGSV